MNITRNKNFSSSQDGFRMQSIKDILKVSGVNDHIYLHKGDDIILVSLDMVIRGTVEDFNDEVLILDGDYEISKQFMRSEAKSISIL